MSLCGSSDCCLRENNELDMQVANPASSPGMRAGDLGIPEPPKKKEPELEPVENQMIIPPPPAEEKQAPTSTAGPLIFIVELEKTAQVTKVGLDVDHGDEQTLEIMLVKDGLVQIYNQGAEDEKKIKTGDRITEVNGITGDNRKMLETVGREQKLKFVVKRIAP